MAPSNERASSGHSLVEVLIALMITLLVMASVFALSRWMERCYQRVSREAAVSAAVTRALDDMAMEIARAGYGLGKLNSRVLASSIGQGPSGDRLTLRSSPSGDYGFFEADLTEKDTLCPVKTSSRFREGDSVLLSDTLGQSEPAVVTAVEGTTLALQSFDALQGELRHDYFVQHKARMVALREVTYRTQLRPDGGQMIVKEVSGRPPRVLAPAVEDLRFDYETELGTDIPLSTVQSTPFLKLVRMTIRFHVGPLPTDKRVLSTAVALGAQSAEVHFAEPGYGLRLARYLHPIDRPIGAASVPGQDWGVILAGSWTDRDASYLYTFLAYGYNMTGHRVESVTWLDSIRGPAALALAPPSSSVGGSLFVVTKGLRKGELYRIHPDGYGVFSPESDVERVYRGEELAQVGGLTFGGDRALYAASRARKTIVRFRFDATGGLSEAEAVVKGLGDDVTSLVTGADGNIYTTLAGGAGRRSPLYRIELDENLEAREPALIRHLPGRCIDLAVEPLSGNLFALVRTSLDTKVVELDPFWLAKIYVQPEVAFSLSEFREEVNSGRIHQPKEAVRRVSPVVIGERIPPLLVPDSLDFLSFDTFGDLYLGSKQQRLVMKFELDDRGFDPHEVILAAVVEETAGGRGSVPRVRLQAWKKNDF